MSRFKPHVVQQVNDSDDIQSFLAEIRAQQSMPNEGPAMPAADQIKDGFVRLADFLKTRERQAGPNLSKRDIGLRAYKKIHES